MKLKHLMLATSLLANIPQVIGQPLEQQPATTSQHSLKLMTQAELNHELKYEYIVMLNQGAPAGTIERLKHDIINTSTLEQPVAFKHLKTIKGFSAYLSTSQRQALAQDPHVNSIELNKSFQSINSRSLSHQSAPITQSINTIPWGLDRLDQAQLPLDNQFTPYGDGTGVHVYVIDSGIRHTHSEFGNRASRDFKASNITSGYGDQLGSGTHLAGIIGGNSYGVAKNVDLHGIKVINNQGEFTLNALIEGIEYVTDHHIAPAVAIIGVSMPYSAALNQAIRAASLAGVSVVVPSGDQFEPACNYSPASSNDSNNGVITVGASNHQDQPTPYSNFGECIDIYAPGLQIQSSWHTTNYAHNTISHSPTAAAHVAGVAAIIRSHYDSCNNQQVKDKLLDLSNENVLHNLPSNTVNRLLAVPTTDYPSNCNDNNDGPPTANIHLSGSSYCGTGAIHWTAVTGTNIRYEINSNNSFLPTHTIKTTHLFILPYDTTVKVRACNTFGCGNYSNSIVLRHDGYNVPPDDEPNVCL